MVQFTRIGGVVTVDKEITKLDQFVLDAINIIKKHADYVIISGYVSIFFGRARATEDVDLFLLPLPSDKFHSLYRESVDNGYEWTVDNPHTLYEDYLQSGLPVSMWKKDFPLLRMEMKIARKPDQLIAFQDKITVKFKGFELFMANIEGQIAYKRYVARSDKDLADARHLEIVFTDIQPARIAEYRKLFTHDQH